MHYHKIEFDVLVLLWSKHLPLLSRQMPNIFLNMSKCEACFYIPIQFYQKFDYRAVGFFFWTKSRKLKETKSIQHVPYLILVMKKLIWLLKCPYTYYIRIFLTLMYKDYKINFVYTSPCHAQ